MSSRFKHSRLYATLHVGAQRPRQGDHFNTSISTWLRIRTLYRAEFLDFGQLFAELSLDISLRMRCGNLQGGAFYELGPGGRAMEAT